MNPWKENNCWLQDLPSLGSLRKGSKFQLHERIFRPHYESSRTGNETAVTSTNGLFQVPNLKDQTPKYLSENPICCFFSFFLPHPPVQHWIEKGTASVTAKVFHLVFWEVNIKICHLPFSSKGWNSQQAARGSSLPNQRWGSNQKQCKWGSAAAQWN